MKNNILITGATGFIGSHLTEMFVRKGLKVVAFDRYNINNDHGWLNKSKFKNKFKIILGDIRDQDSVIKAMKGCDTVIHLAALIGIPYSYVSPLAYVKTNVEGTYNVLEAAKILKLKNIIITSTSEIYGTPKKLPISENDPINCQSPYAATKSSADQLSLSYYKSFNLPVKLIRPFNTYGPRQSNRAIIPTIINQCLKNKNGKIKLGNLNTTRDFNYVEDICNAFYEVYRSKNTFGEILNVGSNTNISVKDLTNKIMKILNVKYKIEIVKERVRPNASEVLHLKCNNNKIKKLTRWRNKTSLIQGLIKTIDWYKKNVTAAGENQHYQI